jgi:hypothetical protein
MDIAPIKEAAFQAIAPMKAATSKSEATKDFLFSAVRADASKRLPEYYFVYFLLVDLLGFENLGQFEKIAWSVPIDYQGRAYLIEHRKFGLGIFTPGRPGDDVAAEQIADLICRGTEVAKPYFEWRANQAVQESQLNVINRASELYERFSYFSDRYSQVSAEAKRRAEERITTQLSETSWVVSSPSWALQREAQWLALSTIESFFSWTEHVFILMAILRGNCSTGAAVAKLANANWDTKFKAALDIDGPKNREFQQGLTQIRRQHRNFVAHGAFGKNGEAFLFHSNCGTVPVMLPDRREAEGFRFGYGMKIVDEDAINLLRDFVNHFWADDRAPAKLYIQDHQLPLILTMAQSDEYRQAMASYESMQLFAHHLAQLSDQHANMDF